MDSTLQVGTPMPEPGKCPKCGTPLRAETRGMAEEPRFLHLWFEHPMFDANTNALTAITPTTTATNFLSARFHCDDGAHRPPLEPGAGSETSV